MYLKKILKIRKKKKTKKKWKFGRRPDGFTSVYTIYTCVCVCVCIYTISTQFDNPDTVNIACMWCMLHTIFTILYAHLRYCTHNKSYTCKRERKKRGTRDKMENTHHCVLYICILFCVGVFKLSNNVNKSEPYYNDSISIHLLMYVFSTYSKREDSFLK